VGVAKARVRSPMSTLCCRSGQDRGCRAVGELRLSEEKELMCDPTTVRDFATVRVRAD
jgi:hypothetical protein